VDVGALPRRIKVLDLGRDGSIPGRFGLVACAKIRLATGNIPKQIQFLKDRFQSGWERLMVRYVSPKQSSFLKDRFQGHLGKPKISWMFYGLPRAAPVGKRTGR
jgi:hypothetical protein